MESTLLLVAFLFLMWTFTYKRKADLITDQQATIDTDRRMQEQYRLRRNSRMQHSIILVLIGAAIATILVLLL